MKTYGIMPLGKNKTAEFKSISIDDIKKSAHIILRHTCVLHKVRLKTFERNTCNLMGNRLGFKCQRSGLVPECCQNSEMVY